MNTPFVKSVVSMALASVLLLGCSAEEDAAPAVEEAPVAAETQDVAPAQAAAEGLAVQAASDALIIEGVPGGVERHVAYLKATVKKINYETRVVKLTDDEGNTRAFKVGPDAINFDQVKQGDRVEIAYAQELLVYLKEKDAPSNDGASGMVERAPEGEKPQAVAVKTAEMTAVVTAVDLDKHTATLKFPEGESRVVQVRPDVEVREDHVGREVVFRTTMATAISVKPAEAETEAAAE